MHTILPGRIEARSCWSACTIRDPVAVVESGIIPRSSDETLVGHCVEVAQLPGDFGPGQHQAPRGGQCAHELGAIALRDHAIVGNYNCTAIRRRADQSSETLLQPKRRMWDHVFGERVTTPLENRLAIRGCDRLARNAKRQTGDEQSAKRVSGNVDTLPVGRSTDQNRPSRMPEFLEQYVAAVFSV